LSIIGIFHTAISVLAVFFAVYALLRYGKINPATDAGRMYVLFTIIACLSSFPIMVTGHPSSAHLIAVAILVLLPIAVYARSIRVFRKKADIVQTLVMSTTLFLSMIPAIIETFTRLPIDEPIAMSRHSPVVIISLTLLLIMYLLGMAYQYSRIRHKRTLKQSRRDERD